MSALKQSNQGYAQAEVQEERKNEVLRRFFRHKLAVIGLVIMTFLVLVAIFAPWLAPHDPNGLSASFEDRPTREHLLGLDMVGRDVFSRLIYASRVSLSVAAVAVTIYVIIGTVLGAIAGYFGRWIDITLTRLADVFLSFPQIMLIIVVVSLFGTSLTNVMVILGLLGWPPIFRIVRGEFLTLRERDFVQAAQSMGGTDHRIIFRHILPNAMGPILVQATFGAATAILTEAALSFLGLGVQPPNASWGNLLLNAQSISVLQNQWWLWVPPGLAIFIAVLAINFVGDGLRDALDPRLKR